MRFLRAPLILLGTIFVITVSAANFTGNATLIHIDYNGMTADVVSLASASIVTYELTSFFFPFHTLSG